jgi:hypothetical protein
MPYPKEELLHHIWLHRLFDQENLLTTDGDAISIIRVGSLNPNSGPDFSAARLKIGETEWSGNVEIHVRSSDWLRHQHQQDAAYSNIILHVVFEDDLQESLGSFPTLELKGHISDQILRRYETMQAIDKGLPCGNQFMEVPELVLNNWIESLLIARLQRKSEEIAERIERNNGDLEQAFQATLFRAFGMKVNAMAFETLGSLIPWKVFSKHQSDPFQLEAILFGAAGFLHEPKEPYQLQLSKEFQFLASKYGMESMQTSVWKFSKMHPKNFPTLRLAQLAALYHQTGQFLGWFRTQEVSDLHSALLVEPSEYWQTHYRFGKEFPSAGNRLGSTMANNILINVLAPFLFVLSEREGNQNLKDNAMLLLEELKPEKNSKVKDFENVGFKPKNALQSQSLIELRTNFCALKKCLFCNVGANILKQQL